MLLGGKNFILRFIKDYYTVVDLKCGLRDTYEEKSLLNDYLSNATT